MTWLFGYPDVFTLVWVKNRAAYRDLGGDTILFAI